MKRLERTLSFEAFKLWYRYYEHRLIDKLVGAYLSEDIKAPPNGGWLRKVRLALFLSTGQMAKKLQMSRSGYSKLERKEALGAITISTLSKLAKAMDCELVYAIRPKTKQQFSQIIWEKLVSECLTHPWVISRAPVFKARALVAIAREKMNEAAFRHRQKWSERP